MKTTVIEAKDLKKVSGKASAQELASINHNAVKAKNGVKTQKDPAVKSEAKDEVKTVAKPEPVVIPKPVLSLEQKIEKIENLKTLIEKRERLEASRKKLSAFVVGANQFSENIMLTDEHGNTFKTSNSEVFSKVVQTINNVLVEKISEIEQGIEF